MQVKCQCNVCISLRKGSVSGLSSSKVFLRKDQYSDCSNYPPMTFTRPRTPTTVEPASFAKQMRAKIVQIIRAYFTLRNITLWRVVSRSIMPIIRDVRISIYTTTLTEVLIQCLLAPKLTLFRHYLD